MNDIIDWENHTKICGTCNERKPFYDFYYSRKRNTPFKDCKECLKKKKQEQKKNQCKSDYIGWFKYNRLQKIRKKKLQTKFHDRAI